MLHEILFNATVPGACMNAVQASKERDRQSKRHHRNDREIKDPDAAMASRRATVWARLFSRFSHTEAGGRD